MNRCYPRQGLRLQRSGLLPLPTNLPHATCHMSHPCCAASNPSSQGRPLSDSAWIVDTQLYTWVGKDSLSLVEALSTGTLMSCGSMGTLSMTPGFMPLSRKLYHVPGWMGANIFQNEHLGEKKTTSRCGFKYSSPWIDLMVHIHTSLPRTITSLSKNIYCVFKRRTWRAARTGRNQIATTAF